MGAVEEPWSGRLLSVYPSLRRFAAVVGSADMCHGHLVTVRIGGVPVRTPVVLR